jgi:phosphoglycolate phosphatase/pyrophosphatase PpaX
LINGCPHQPLAVTLLNTPYFPAIMNYIFDLDGTLGNTLPLCVAAFRRALEPHLGREVSAQEIMATFGPSEEGTIQLLAPHACDEALEDYLFWYRELHAGFPRPFDGIVEILDHLRSRNSFIGMVTGKARPSALLTLEQYGLTDYFVHIGTGSPDGPVKPEKIKEIIAGRTDPRESYLYVGDSPSDVDACRTTNIKIVAAAWAETTERRRLKRKNPDYYFESVAEFGAFVRDREETEGRCGDG